MCYRLLENQCIKTENNNHDYKLYKKNREATQNLLEMIRQRITESENERKSQGQNYE